MSSSLLPICIENATDALGPLVKTVTAGPPQRKHVQIACFFFRQRATAELLLWGQTDAYYQNLVQSSGLYLYFLQNANDTEKRVSDQDALFDAINAGLWDVCQQMTFAIRQALFQPDYEYEDDYIYAQILMALFFIPHSDELVRQWLDDYERVLEGRSDTRYDICRAFVENDRLGFEASFEELLEARRDRIEGMIDRGAMTEEVWAWARYVSTEGLALSRLADLKAFEQTDYYPQIPCLLRSLPKVRFDPDLWRQA